MVKFILIIFDKFLKFDCLIKKIIKSTTNKINVAKKEKIRFKQTE